VPPTSPPPAEPSPIGAPPDPTANPSDPTRADPTLVNPALDPPVDPTLPAYPPLPADPSPTGYPTAGADDSTPVMPTPPASPWARPTTPGPQPYVVLPPAPAPASPGYLPPGYRPPPTHPVYAPPTAYPVPPPPRNSDIRLVFGVIVAVLLLAGAGAAVGVIKDRADRRSAAAVTAPSAGPTDTDPFGLFGGDPFSPNPFSPDPFSPDPFSGGGPFGSGATVDEGAAALNMPIGRTIHVSDTHGKWTLTVVSAQWRTSNCDTNGVAPDPIGELLVVNVAFEVTQGLASINPFDFSYSDPDGQPGLSSIFSGCEPRLDAGIDLHQGSKRRGTVVFDVIGKTGGTIEYGPLFSQLATWNAPA
jgi:hypothetical protein